jgi:hypothetical protein
MVNIKNRLENSNQKFKDYQFKGSPIIKQSTSNISLAQISHQQQIKNSLTNYNLNNILTHQQKRPLPFPPLLPNNNNNIPPSTSTENAQSVTIWLNDPKDVQNNNNNCNN